MFHPMSPEMLTNSRNLTIMENIQLLSFTALVSWTALAPLTPTAAFLRKEVEVLTSKTGTVENKETGDIMAIIINKFTE